MGFDDIDIEALRQGRSAKWTQVDADVLPAWVADMDFAVAEPIRDALAAMARRSDLGYPLGPTREGVPAAFARRMEQRYGWQVEPARIDVLTDVVQGLHLAVSLFSEPGDAVVCPMPIYPPFLEALRAHRSTPVWKRFVRTPQGWRVDLDRLRAEMPAGTKLLLLCNPHNPTGHALARDELEALAALAVERDLVVVSDEIHADLVLPGAVHVPFATISPEAAARTITLSSASKAYNIAGLRCAVAVFGSRELQQTFHRVHRHARGGLNTMGLLATEVAWSSACDAWHDAVVRYLAGNRDFVAGEIARRWPGMVHARTEATYLAWIDCNALGLEPSPQRWLLERARVALSDGAEFGEDGRGFVRLNFATSRAVLAQILDRMDAALASA